MPFLVAALLGGLAQVMGSLVGRVLLSLGMSYVTYSGLTVGTDYLLSYMKTSLGGLTGDVASFVAWCWVDKAISLIASTFSASFALKMAGGTTLSKLTIKKGSS